MKCESKTSALKRRRTPSDRELEDSKADSPQDEESDEDDEDEDATLIMRTTKLMKQVSSSGNPRMNPPTSLIQYAAIFSADSKVRM